MRRFEFFINAYKFFQKFNVATLRPSTYQINQVEVALNAALFAFMI